LEQKIPWGFWISSVLWWIRPEVHVWF